MNNAPDVLKNEAAVISFRGRFLRSLILFVCGLASATMFPPLGWSVVGFIALAPLIFCSFFVRMRTAAWYGFVWGAGWYGAAFWWLREIDPVIPWLIGPVMGVWPMAMFAAAIPLFYRALVLPYQTDAAGFDARKNFFGTAAWREILCAAALAGWMAVLEYSRGFLLPWNFLAASQYRNTPLLQIAAWTGSYGISFLLAFSGAAAAFAMRTVLGIRATRRYKRPMPVFVALVMLMAVIVFGAQRISAMMKTPEPERLVGVGVIQGDVSQRRNADHASAAEALDIYLGLTENFLKRNGADFVVWPETAVPYPLRAANPVSLRYRAEVFRLVRTYKVPMLIGSLDFENVPAGENRFARMLNSALLIDREGRFAGRYDKIIRVPFGEYVPWRRYLPKWIVRRIDMNRDLLSGQDPAPLEPAPGVRAGMAICFEDVFAPLARREARLGANMLLVISNDAWYPRSSEPVQHLANAVLRSVETALPMIRCGNSSTSCVVTPYGAVSAVLKGGLDTRARHAGILACRVRERNEETFYTRHGDWFVLCCGALALAAFAAGGGRVFRMRRTIAEAFEQPAPERSPK